jgi:uncharacterized membrane protein
VIITVAIPMVIGVVPPNRLYGFRTRKTLSSPEIWYRANRVSGWFMIAACIVAITFNLILWTLHPDWPVKRLLFWMANATALSIALSLIPSFIYLKRL